MGWADDEGESKGAKEEPRRKPRRASDEVSETKDAKPRRPRKAQDIAWGSASMTKSPTPQRRDDDSDGDQPRRRSRHYDDEGETEITMIIPDLDEQAEEDITLQVAEAPRNRTIKLPTLAELNADLAAHSIIPCKPGEKRLDLSLLNNRLVPPSLVKENTEAWTWDVLLRDVARDFQEESERDEVLKEKKAQFEAKFATDKKEDAGEELLKRQAKGGRRAAPKPKREEGKEEKNDEPQNVDTAELDKALGKKEKTAAKGGRRARKREPAPEVQAEAKKPDSDSDDDDIAPRAAEEK